MRNAWKNFFAFLGFLFSALGRLGKAFDEVATVAEDQAETWRKGKELENAAKLVKLKNKYQKLDTTTKTELINARQAKADADKPQQEQEQQTVEEQVQTEFGFDLNGSDSQQEQKKKKSEGNG